LNALTRRPDGSLSWIEPEAAEYEYKYTSRC